MNNLIFGIAAVIFCSYCFYLSWKLQLKDRCRISILLLLLGAFILRIYAASDLFLHTWDERYHALVAKNLILHPFTPTLYDNPILAYDFKNWTSNYIWLAKPPIPLWCMSISIFFFGNSELAVRLPSVIASVLSVLVTYNIAKIIFNNRIAWLSAFLHSIHGMLIELTAGRISSDHVETFFVFFIELAIWVGILAILSKKNNILFIICCGILTGFALLSKFLPALIVIPVWLSFCFLYNKKFTRKSLVHLALIVFIACSTFLIWIVHVLSAFPQEGIALVNSLIDPIIVNVQEVSQPKWYYLNNIRIVFGEIIYIPLIWICYQSFTERKSIKHIPFLLWIFIPFILFTLAQTKRHTYLLISAPAVFIVTSYFYFKTLEYRNERKIKLLYNLTLILLIALPIRYMVERIKPFRIVDRNPKWVTDLRNLNEQKITRGVLLNYQRPIEAMFYTNIIAYECIPDRTTIIDLITKGYRILINDDGNIPDNIRAIKGITVIKLEYH